MPEYSREDFLSEILPTVSYLMPQSTQILVPTTTFDIEQISKNYKHDPIGQKMYHVGKDVLLKIITSKNKDTKELFDDLLSSFEKSCTQITSMLRQKYPLQNLAKQDLTAFEKSKDQIIDITWIDEKNKKHAIELIDILVDYYKIMMPIVEKLGYELEQAITQVDYFDLKESLYSAVLAYACLMTMVGRTDTHSQIKFVLLCEIGLNHARNLDTYTDTLDILVHPNEAEFVKKFE